MLYSRQFLGLPALTAWWNAGAPSYAAIAASITTPRASGVAEVNTVVITNPQINDVFTLKIGGSHAVTFTATTTNPADIVTGLIASIAAGGSSWTSAVTTSTVNGNLVITAQATNTALVITGTVASGTASALQILVVPTFGIQSAKVPSASVYEAVYTQ